LIDYLLIFLTNKIFNLMQALWGIDLGGTKIEGVILKSSLDPQVLTRLRVPTEADKGYLHIIEQIKKLIAMMIAESGQHPTQLGIGTPGTLDPILNTIKNSNTVCLNGQPFGEDVSKALGVPVKIANDANCFALAEARMGSVKEVMPEAEVVFGVIMGTGVGGGIVVNGKVLNGRQGIAGEWGHNFLDDSGGACFCGKSGCVERIIAGPSLERFYHEISGNKVSLKEIVQRHQAQSDAHATNTINRLTHFFGLAISNIINILDPDVIVLGGGVGNIDYLYTEGVASAKRFIFNHRLDTLFLKPKLGDSAGVFGAAMLTA
jgi:predicted NBD/HSP70 family sugar kinase